jgi:hypothetical protein
MGEHNAILLDSRDTCTPDAIAIRGGGRVGVLVRKLEMELRKKGRKSRFEGRLQNPLGWDFARQLPRQNTRPGEGAHNPRENVGGRVKIPAVAASGCSAAVQESSRR